MKKVLINVEERELRVAILEDDQLVELYIDSLDDKAILNNIYKGKIEGIIPGLKAAFVNIGLERNAFLHFDDVRPDILLAKAGLSAPRPAASPDDSVRAPRPQAPARHAAPAPRHDDGDDDDDEAGEIAETGVATADSEAGHPAGTVAETADQASRRRRRRGRRGGRKRLDADGNPIPDDSPDGVAGGAVANADGFDDGDDDDDDDDADGAAEGGAATEGSGPRPQHQPQGPRHDRQPFQRPGGGQGHQNQNRPHQGGNQGNNPQHGNRGNFGPAPDPGNSIQPAGRHGGFGFQGGGQGAQQARRGKWRRDFQPVGDDVGNTVPGGNPHHFSTGSGGTGFDAIPDDPFAMPGDAPLPGNDIFGAPPSQNRPRPYGGGQGQGQQGDGKRKRRGGRNRSMKKKGGSYMAARARKTDDAPVAEAPVAAEKPKRATKAKAVAAEVAATSAAEAPAKAKRSTKAKAEVPAPVEAVAEAKPKRVTKAKAIETAAEAPAAAEAAAAKPKRAAKAKATEAVAPASEAAATPAPAAKGRRRTPAGESAVPAPTEVPAPAAAPTDDKAEAASGGRSRRGSGRRGGGAAPSAESVDSSSETVVPSAPAVPAGATPAESDSADDRSGRRRRGRRGGRAGRPGDETPVPGDAPRAADSGDGDSRSDSTPGDLFGSAASDAQPGESAPSDRPAGEGSGRPPRPERGDRKGRDRFGRDRDRQGRPDRPGFGQAPHAQQGGGTPAPYVDRRPKTPLFTEVFKKGDELMVQVTKEEIGMKGARVSSFISLPGRYLVMLPYPNEEGGVSRKVEDLSERKRLKRILRDISSTDEAAFIIRTAGIDRDEEEIAGDVEFLQGEWKAIDGRYAKAKTGDVCYDDHDILYRLARDTFDDNVGQILIDDPVAAEKLKEILGKLIPELMDKVEVYDEPENIFHRYGVEKQIQKAARRKVWLKSGGYLIIDEAEALTAIDVNSGKFVGKDDQEKMILKTNMEAARTIGKELKLRDIGGLIVVDFIDMKDQRNRDQLLNEFKAQFKRDRSKTSISNVSEFGLVEMTRKRVRRSLRKSLFTDCPYCQGAGVILNEQQVWLHIKHEIVRLLEAARPFPPSLNIVVNPRLRAYMDQNYRETLRKLEQKYSVEIRLGQSDVLHMENYAIEKLVPAPAGGAAPVQPAPAQIAQPATA